MIIEKMLFKCYYRTTNPSVILISVSFQPEGEVGYMYGNIRFDIHGDIHGANLTPLQPTENGGHKKVRHSPRFFRYDLYLRRNTLDFAEYALEIASDTERFREVTDLNEQDRKLIVTALKRFRMKQLFV